MNNFQLDFASLLFKINFMSKIFKKVYLLNVYSTIVILNNLFCFGVLLLVCKYDK